MKTLRPLLMVALWMSASVMVGQEVAQTTRMAQQQAASAATAPTLTLQQAEQMALAHNPRIAVSRLLALAEGQRTREFRAGLLPTATMNISAVDSHEGSRITAGGGINNPVVYQRAAAGVTVSQLITDFGRSRNLVSSADLQAKAQESFDLATRSDVVLAVDEAFYRALGSQSVLAVAEGTVHARQQIVDRISALTNAKLKSDLDLNFANVSLAQAKLLLLDAQNENVAAMTALSTLLGDEPTVIYTLVDDVNTAPPLAPTDPEPLVAQALKSRPDLVALNEQYQAAKKFSDAESDLWRPTITALGVAGGTPVRADAITSSWYGAAGVNLSIPIFNGFLFSARANEANYRAQAAGKQVDLLREAIARDVKTTVLQAQTNFERISVTQQLAEQANSAFDLAQTRYKLGLSNIVELSQAQLAQTEAQIAYARARYSYQGSLVALRYQTGQ
ncbi:MAG: TolC family protein [Acidobacteria bacterium]|nr:TolC family protein [Acidobacteriota bacterium]